MIRANAPAPLLPTQRRAMPGLPAGRARDDHRLDDEHRAARRGRSAVRAAPDTRASRPITGRGRRGADPLRRLYVAGDVHGERDRPPVRGAHAPGDLGGSTWARGPGVGDPGLRAPGARHSRRGGRPPWRARSAGCWLAKVPRRGVLRFDLDAVSGPPDSSAQAVAAAGLATLALRRPRAAWRGGAHSSQPSSDSSPVCHRSAASAPRPMSPAAIRPTRTSSCRSPRCTCWSAAGSPELTLELLAQRGDLGAQRGDLVAQARDLSPRSSASAAGQGRASRSRLRRGAGALRDGSSSSRCV